MLAMPIPTPGYHWWMRITLLALCLLMPALSLAQTLPAKPKKLGLCVGCHGETGRATLAHYPNLHGQNAAYLSQSLQAYRSGARKNAQMAAVVGLLSAADIEALARWYSAQTCAPQP